jgi:hypothetical protein
MNFKNRKFLEEYDNECGKSPLFLFEAWVFIMFSSRMVDIFQYSLSIKNDN